MRRIVTTGLIAALLIGTSFAACAETVKLEYKFKKGDVAKYNLAVDVNAKLPNVPGVPNQGQFNFKMSMLQVQKVMDVYKDGSAKLKVWSGNINMSIPGMPVMPTQNIPGSTVYMKMSKRGRVLSTQIPELAVPTSKSGKGKAKSKASPKPVPPIPGMPGMDMNQMMNQYSQYGGFPADPVEVGTPWVQDIPLPLNLGTVNMTSTITSSSEQVLGTQAAKLVRVLRGKIDLSQVFSMMSSEFARGYNNAASRTGKTRIAPPKIAGTVDFAGSTADYFDTAAGKLVGTTGAGTATIMLKLPPEIAKEGIPADMNIVIDGSMTMSRI